MNYDDLAQMSQDELIELILTMHAQLVALQAEYEALKMIFGKGRKPPANSSNSSQPPSRDQKGNRPQDRQRHRHGPFWNPRITPSLWGVSRYKSRGDFGIQVGYFDQFFR